MLLGRYLGSRFLSPLKGLGGGGGGDFPMACAMGYDLSPASRAMFARVLPPTNAILRPQGSNSGLTPAPEPLIPSPVSRIPSPVSRVPSPYRFPCSSSSAKEKATVTRAVTVATLSHFIHQNYLGGTEIPTMARLRDLWLRAFRGDLTRPLSSLSKVR